MAVQFHELPVSVFPKECRHYIARLNRELRDLFGLEGSLSNPRTSARSDATVARQNIATVDSSRITPSLTTIISNLVVGSSTTASNVNTAGVGVFKQKSNEDLQFKGINAGSNKVSITADVANNEIDIDVVEANFTVIGMSTSVPLAVNLGGTGGTTELEARDSLQPTIRRGDLYAGTAVDAGDPISDIHYSRLPGTLTANFALMSKPLVAAGVAWRQVTIDDVLGAPAVLGKGSLITSDGITGLSLGVGTDYHVLRANSGVSSGLEWANLGATNTYSYGSTAIAGVATTFARSDDVMVYPEALATAADRTKTLTLTNDSARGALLTASSVYGQSFLSFAAPSSTTYVSVSSEGHISAASSVPSTDIVLQFVETGTPASSTMLGVLGQITTNAASKGGKGLRGFVLASHASGNTSTTSQIGIEAEVKSGGAGVTGSLIGFNSILSRSSGSVQTWYGFKYTPSISTGSGTVENSYGFYNTKYGTFLPAITNEYGFYSEGLNEATNRWGFYYAGAGTATATKDTGFECGHQSGGTTRVAFLANGVSVGSPTTVTGFQSTLHVTGTNRRSFIGGNSLECTDNHMIVGTSGMGFVVKDTVDANYYMISTAGGVVGCSSIGTSLPAV